MSETRQTVKSEIETDVETETNETKSETVIARLNDQSQICENMEEIIEEITYSMPDSVGNQYPLSAKRTTRKHMAECSNNVTTSVEKTTDETTHESTTDNSKSVVGEQTEITEESSVKVGTPSWVLWLILLVVSAALTVVLLFLKKWRII